MVVDKQSVLLWLLLLLILVVVVMVMLVLFGVLVYWLLSFTGWKEKGCDVATPLALVFFWLASLLAQTDEDAFSGFRSPIHAQPKRRATGKQTKCKWTKNNIPANATENLVVTVAACITLKSSASKGGFRHRSSTQTEKENKNGGHKRPPFRLLGKRLRRYAVCKCTKRGARPEGPVDAMRRTRTSPVA